jgi:signal transduction histidine kinase
LEEKSKLEQEIVEATNRERRRIAQDLHDGLGQQLTGIALRLKLWHDRTHEDEAGLTQEIERMIVLINEATSQTRQLARGLDPVDFIQGGLEGALRGLTDWVQRTGGVECVVDLVRVGDSMDHRTGLAIYRLTQEALNNALKHAKATRMLVRLHAEARAWQLTVMDNGVGFAGSKFEALEGLGLKIMRYRAESLGGVFHIGPAEGGGTEIRVTIPRSA